MSSSWALISNFPAAYGKQAVQTQTGEHSLVVNIIFTPEVSNIRNKIAKQTSEKLFMAAD